jgi:hypothetical protein
MMLGGVLGVFHSVEMVSMSHVRVVRGCFVFTVEVMFGGFVVMACSVLVMLRCLGVMMGCLVGHGKVLSLRVISDVRPAENYGDQAQVRDYSVANSG